MNDLSVIEPALDPVAQAYQNDRFVYLDIETIPSQSEELLEEFKRKVRAPATFKKPESIDNWLAENRESAAKEQLAKTSFDGGRGHVCTIAWAKNDGKIHVEHAKTVDDEARIIAAFFKALDRYHSERIVGHNVAGFDLPFLMKRAICLGIKMPDRQSFPRNPKAWDKNVCDTEFMWAGGGNNYVSLDRLCGILGVPGKDGFDGSMVAEAWAKGDHDTIATYCAADVDRVRRLHQHFLKAGW